VTIDQIEEMNFRLDECRNLVEWRTVLTYKVDTIRVFNNNNNNNNNHNNSTFVERHSAIASEALGFPDGIMIRRIPPNVPATCKGRPTGKDTALPGRWEPHLKSLRVTGHHLPYGVTPATRHTNG